jgi:hypothetical protein
MSNERLTPELQSLLSAEKESAPPDGARDRVAQRLAQSLGVTLAAAGAATAATSGAHGAQVATGGVKAIVGKSLAAKLLVVVAIGGVGAGGVVGTVALVRHHRAAVKSEQATGDRRPATGNETDNGSPVPSPPPPSPPTTPSPSSPVAGRLSPVAGSEVAPSSAPVAPPRAEPHRARRSDLPAERALLADARSAMQATDAARALEILADHARRFPHGQLAEERDALRVGALWLSGDHDAARRRADEFSRRHPDSLFLPSVQRAVTEPPGGAQ